ncbi:hypothetical protein DB347_25135 [Opitutaceae bacterium EW11]|nr:hypothetical protein DB347_25135 [Opitutaceae bacterium EW11]
MADSLTDVVALQQSGIFALGHEPSIRTLRTWTKLRKIPHYRVGHFIFYDPAEVAAHIRTKLRIPARGEERKPPVPPRSDAPPAAPGPSAEETEREPVKSDQPHERLPARLRFRRSEGFRILKYTNPSGSVAYRVSGWLRGTRIRRNFATRADAEAELQLLTVQATQADAELRTAVTRLTPTQLSETETAYQRIKDRPHSLLFYVEHALERFREPNECKKLGAAVNEYLAARRHEHDEKLLSTPYLENLERGLQELAKQSPELAVAELTGPHVVTFLELRHPSTKTFNNRRGVVSAFLNYCLQHGWIESNPLARIPARRVRRPRGAAKTFSAAQTREFMQALETFADGRFVVYFALAFFAGIRPGVPHGEMSRLTPSAVKLDEGVIEISAEVSKVREPRKIVIQPNLAAWLRAYPLDRFAIVPDHFQEARTKLTARFHLSHDVTRHTFISMFVAKFRSVGEAALQSGNSESIIRRHYLDSKSKAEAEDFFSIVPANRGTPGARAFAD